jgi:hypothetical protein
VVIMPTSIVSCPLLLKSFRAITSSIIDDMPVTR